MEIKILSRLLGHADVNITYNIYVHLYEDGFEEMYHFASCDSVSVLFMLALP